MTAEMQAWRPVQLQWVQDSVTRWWKFSKVAQSSEQTVLSLKDVIQETLRVSKYFGRFWKKICHLEVSKIAQSGHTEPIKKYLDHISPEILQLQVHHFLTWFTMGPLWLFISFY